MSKVLLAIDQGTTGSTAAIFDYDSLRVLAQHSVDFPQHYPSPGLVEHSPGDIWRSVLQAISAALTKWNGSTSDIAAIGITNQRETTLAWNRKSGATLGSAIVWQDRRTAPYCEKLKREKKTLSAVHKKTGLVIDPYFSATKMRWILQENAEAASLARQKNLCLGTIDTFLIWRLTGGDTFATDHTNACRTMLYTLERGSFDSELCSLFKVPKEALPEIRDNTSHFGVTKDVPGLPDGIPICGSIGDQQAALLGQGCQSPGEAKITYGTGAFCLLNIGKKPLFSKHGLLTSVGFSAQNARTFVLEGSAFIAGAAVQFLRDQFGWFKEASECEELALKDPRDPNLVFIPALVGLGAPYWNPSARGALFGLTRGSTQSQIVRAVLESIALQNVQLLQTMRKAYTKPLKRVGVDGGASQNNALMQFQADTLGAKLVRPENIETTSKGAAIAAKLGLDPGAPAASAEEMHEFIPQMKKTDVQKIVEHWLSAVEALNVFYAA